MIVLRLRPSNALHLANNAFPRCHEKWTRFRIDPFMMLFGSFEGLRHIPHVQYNSPSGQYLAQNGHCIFEETSPSSNNSIFPILGMVFLDPSLNLLNSHVLLKSAMTDSVRWSFFLDLEVLHFVVLLEHGD